MTTPADVLISGDRHLIVHGQLGNLQAKISQLEHMLKVGKGEHFLLYLQEIAHELDFLREVYPAVDGGVKYINPQAGVEADTPNSSEIDWWSERAKIRSALRDMRVLMNAAALSFQHEGNIDCHLKVMLDKAWIKAADEAGIEFIDDIPF